MIWGCDSVTIELMPVRIFPNQAENTVSKATFDLSGVVIEASVHTS
jgi:hypothetical protein